MVVDPLLKQDLLLIKKAFENGALEQDSREANLVSFVSTAQQTRATHQNIKSEASNYPSSSFQEKKLKNDQSLLKRAQAECIPCLSRIKSLSDLDMTNDIFATLMVYDKRQLENFVDLFKAISHPNMVQQDICSAYMALRSNCIPDIKRLVSALTLLSLKLRSFNLKGLKDQLMSLLGQLIINQLVFSGLNLDMYTQLITNTLRCIVNDINVQIRKLEPILSRDGYEEIARLGLPDRGPYEIQSGEPERDGRGLDTDSATRVRDRAEAKAKKWFPNDFNYSEKATDTLTGLLKKVEGGEPYRLERKQVFSEPNRDERGLDTDSATNNAPNAEGLYKVKTEYPSGRVNLTKGYNSFVNFNSSVGVGKMLADMVENATDVIDNKLDNATQELLKVLKLSDSNFKDQLHILNQIDLIRSVLGVLKTIESTRGDFDPCGGPAGRNFFNKISFPGQEVIVDGSDADNPEITILPPEIKINNPIVEDILNDNGINTASPKGSEKGSINAGRVVVSNPILINISKCLDGTSN